MTTQTGAEATVTFLPDRIIKEREPKTYRHPELDERLRVQRTRREASMLAKAPVRVPTVLLVEKTRLELERINGVRLRDCLPDNATALRYGAALGTMIRTLHDADIMHGDLTTSNVLVEDGTNELVLIDFGLSVLTKRIEDKAVDLHVLRETLTGSHPHVAEPFWQSFSQVYARNEASTVLERLTAVEARGRHKVSH